MPLGAARLSLLAYQAAVAAGGRTAKTLTANGNVEVSTVQSKFGGASARFFTTDATDGSTDTIVTNTSDDFIFSGDFTWETWVYIIDNSSNDTMTFLGNRGGFNANNLYIAARTTDNKWQWGNSTMGANITTQTFSYNTWYHIALVRDGMGTNNFTFYVNGVALQSDTDTNTLGGGGANFISIGGIDAATDSFGINGYMDEVRVSDNARYTSGFTPSTSAFANDDNTLLLVHCDGANGSTTFTDDTVTPLATGGTFSTYNDGTNDYAIHTLTSSDTFTPLESINIDALIVGGGGGGGSSDAGNIAGGGGGGAQVRYQSSIAVTAQNYTITIGAGGAAGANGNDTSAFGYTSEGGGGGGGSQHQTGNSRTNAAGGGGGGHWQGGKAGGTGTYAGGAGTDGPEIGGAGGGNGGVGSTASGQSGGAGGNGVSTTDTFASGTQYYGGGGGGGGLASWANPGIGVGTHGGGDGSKTSVGNPATANTGSGGGGGGGSNKSGGTGGSGVVIIRYQL